MAVYNYAGGEINTKIVYYGPGLSGKTTNLEHIYSKLPPDIKGKMVSMKTRTDRTLFFDFLPFEVGEVNGMKLRFLLYTVPGQVYYNATRKLVLKGVDAVVFVADSTPDRMPDNVESLQNLEDNLNDLGMTLKEIPWVIQFNKRDLPGCIDRETMERDLNAHGASSFEAVATTGEGVYETLEGVAQLVIGRMQMGFKKEEKKGEEEPKMEAIRVEVVAKGSSSSKNSEAGNSSSITSAEKGEEERESVSEFVDRVFQDKNGGGEGVALGATREGYEKYGHVVELSDEENRDSDTRPQSMNIISDPLGKLDVREEEEKTDAGSSGLVSTTGEDRTVRIPVHISQGDMKKDVPVKLILEIKLDSN